MNPEVRKFVEAQKRKDRRTVEQMYIENLRKEKRKIKLKNKKSDENIYRKKNKRICN